MTCSAASCRPLWVNAQPIVRLYKFLTTPNHILYLKGLLLEVSAHSPRTANPVKNDTSLLAHELLCLHLKCFYGVQPWSPSSEAPTVRPLAKKVGKKFSVTSSFRRGSIHSSGFQKRQHFREGPPESL
jgi:hypothetical protein